MKIMNVLKKNIKLLVILPFLLGLTGFSLNQMNFLDAAFNSVLLYVFGYPDSPGNVLVEIARWTAPLSTASGLFFLVKRFRFACIHKMQYHHGNSTAVYGDPENKEIILSQLGKTGMNGQNEFIQAQKYIFAGTEQENFRLYAQFKKQIGTAPVYLKSESLRAQMIQNEKLHFFSTEEVAARLFLKANFLYPQFVKNQKRLSIVFVGFGRLGEELLTSGLQSILYSPDQKVEYTIFGDGKAFLSLHPYLSEIKDTIRFVTHPWYEEKEMMEHADMLIVLEQQKQADLLCSMLSVLTRNTIHVFAENPFYLNLLDQKNRLCIFDWKKDAQAIEYIFDDRLLFRAKTLNLRYAHLYSGVEENTENLQTEWKKLSAFTRYSNISAADYHEVCLEMLHSAGKTIQEACKTPELLDRLAHLEHIRWCRYHYLNNWSYGLPANGKRKDAILRIHTDLVPYATLSEREKEKDRENIRVLASLD